MLSRRLEDVRAKNIQLKNELLNLKRKATQLQTNLNSAKDTSNVLNENIYKLTILPSLMNIICCDFDVRLQLLNQ